MGSCDINGGIDCPKLLVSMHYDAVVGTPGVSDDGIAVAVSLEMIRSLVADDFPTLPYTIIFFFNNAEECGLLGARQFVHHDLYKNVRASINLEGGGSGGQALLFRASDSRMVSAYAESAYIPVASVIGNDLMSLGLVDSRTDYGVYSLNGGSGLDIAFFRYRYFYHTKLDAWYEGYMKSIIHMADSALKTTISLINDEEFMTKRSRGKSSVVFWSELYGFMPVVGYELYKASSIILMLWAGFLSVYGFGTGFNFVRANHRYVKNFGAFDIISRSIFGVLGSVLLPVCAVAVVDKIRPMTVYGNPLSTRVLICLLSLVGALLPFVVVPSVFTSTRPTVIHQRLLNWHLAQLVLLISWLPFSVLIVFSSFYSIGLFYSHAAFIFFGCAAISFEWFFDRRWFGQQPKQDESEKSPSTTAGAADIVSRAKHHSDQLYNPNWMRAISLSLALPLLTATMTLYTMLLGLEPTLVDGTPTIAVSVITSLFSSVISVSILPFVLTSPKSIQASISVCIAIILMSILRLLGGPHTLFSGVVVPPFAPQTPVKLFSKFEVDLSAPSTPATTFAFTSSSLVIPYLVPHIFPNSSGIECASVSKRTTRCEVDAARIGLPRERLPSIARALDVLDERRVDADTWLVSVRSAYGRVCFAQGIENDGEWGSGGYPFSVWPGGVSQQSVYEDSRTLGRAMAYHHRMNEVATFTVKVNRAMVEELGVHTLEVRVGCFVDDLGYFPAWEHLQTRYLPDWAVLQGPGNGGVTLFKTFELDL
ncbi:Endoplasmic reticulum metallopeptidase 1 [Entophlyctis sp. JEL0112]|nr:Endoplasmic reticulum metallopeptidase 1 [Entophlyctis sp. JEL0112]